MVEARAQAAEAELMEMLAREEQQASVSGCKKKGRAKPPKHSKRRQDLPVAIPPSHPEIATDTRQPAAAGTFRGEDRQGEEHENPQQNSMVSSEEEVGWTVVGGRHGGGVPQQTDTACHSKRKPPSPIPLPTVSTSMATRGAGSALPQPEIVAGTSESSAMQTPSPYRQNPVLLDGISNQPELKPEPEED